MLNALNGAMLPKKKVYRYINGKNTKEKNENKINGNVICVIKKYNMITCYFVSK